MNHSICGQCFQILAPPKEKNHILPLPLEADREHIILSLRASGVISADTTGMAPMWDILQKLAGLPSMSTAATSSLR